MTPGNPAYRTSTSMTDLASVRGDLKETNSKLGTLTERMATLESEIKHLREDFKWIKTVLVAGISIGVVIGIIVGVIGSNVR